MKLKQLTLIAAVIIILTAVFCLSFVYFYVRANKEEQSDASAIKQMGIPLPPVDLFDANGTLVNGDTLRQGKVVLIFTSPDCPACRTEMQFLKGIIGDPQLNGKVSFYGIVSFGSKNYLAKAQESSPFKLLYDEGAHLAVPLGITRVPIKVFVQDGVIKKSWGGASPETQSEFKNWIAGLN